MPVIAKPQYIAARLAEAPASVLCIAQSLRGKLVGLSPQSLNRYAASVSKAEALCAEIASILKGLQGMVGSLARTDAAQAETEVIAQKAGMARR